MCTQTNLCLDKRSRDEVGKGKCLSFEGPSKKQRTEGSVAVPVPCESTLETSTRSVGNDSSEAAADNEKLLDESFQPTGWHVIYGRERRHKEHVGNKRLRVLIANNLKAYVEAPTRREKSVIVDAVWSQIRLYGGFVKKTENGRWLAIGGVQCREKVGHSFRDCMKFFKGRKPERKQAQWTQAQNSIFSNLNLRAASPISPPPLTLSPANGRSARSVSMEPLEVGSSARSTTEEPLADEVTSDCILVLK